MFARAMRNSETTNTFQASAVAVEVPFSLHVYKNGEKHIMTNYKSIFLLLSFSKISEKLTFTRLLQHFIDNNILPKEQFSFKSNSPADKAIFKLLNGILNALINKLTIGGIFCDLEKAYDSVDHNILVSKLQYDGIMGPMYALIQSYVTGRYQHVVLNSKISYQNIHSKWGTNSKVFLQGSILGPLLFLIYVNELTIIFNSNPVPILFAGDKSVLLTTSNMTDLEKNTNKTLKQLIKIV
jgi:hypothetical protein